MTADIWIGLALILVAGVAVGNCMLPMKYTRHWKWENTWLIFSLVSLLIIPWLLAWLAIPRPLEIYAQASAAELGTPFLYGFGWGIAQVLFGLSIVRLGMALGYAIIIGLGAMGGTMVPLIAQHPEVLASAKGTLVLVGIGIMIAGIVACSYAGRQREKAGAGQSSGAQASYTAGVIVAVICGLMAPMINYSLAFGQSLAGRAIAQGASAANANYAVWPVGLLGGLVPNILYSVYLLNKNHTWSGFRKWTPDVNMAVLMGLLWMGSVAIYGMAAGYIGALGTSVGWGIYQVIMILAANLSGVLTGEWRNAGRRPVYALGGGLGLLALAVVVMSAVNR